MQKRVCVDTLMHLLVPYLTFFLRSERASCGPCTSWTANANEVYCSLCKRFSQQSAQKSEKRQKRRQEEQRKKRVKRRKKSLEKNTRNFLSLILKSTPSYSGTYHMLDGGIF